MVMDNAIEIAQRQKKDRYRALVNAIQVENPDSVVNFRPMRVGVMGTIPVAIQGTLKEIQAKAQTSWVINQMVQAIENHNHKLWVVRNQMHNRQQAYPDEMLGRWVPGCRWLQREFFQYCENLEQISHRENTELEDLETQLD